MAKCNGGYKAGARMAAEMNSGGVKRQKFAVGGAARVRKGGATPAGAPKRPSIPSAKSKMTMPRSKAMRAG